MGEILKKKIHVIINPVSGTKSKKNIPDKIIETVDSLQYEIDFFTTQYEGHATEIASQSVKDKADYVIAVGGDGTVNEVAKALVNTDVVLGIIPSGSGNGLARDLYIPMNRTKAINILKDGNIKRIDYGIANDNIFFCTCGVGFDAKVSEKALTQSKRGVLMYAKNMITTFFYFEPEKYKVICAEGTFEDEAFVVTCANASQYGNNAYIAPHADIQDGKMNISIIKPLSTFNVPKTMIQMLSKNLEVAKNTKLVELITSEAIIEREKEGVMHLDGNAIYTDKNINVSIVKQGLNVLVPKKIPKSTTAVQSFITTITRWV
ncbi:diacylglycerol kinase family lipid kinase [Dysgonomonas sp. OttesenSCG-928-M03]|nr:diacylglycerol kinase family lipid kinase [Dysgonomonas sp. OttesenSCG-928-M03]